MSTTLLKKTLRINATYSVVCGIALLSFTSEFSLLFSGISELILQILASGLFLFALHLFYVSNQKPINISMAKAITWWDWGWVAGSVLLVAITYENLSILAIDTILGTSTVVALCAYFQGKGIVRVSGSVKQEASQQSAI